MSSRDETPPRPLRELIADLKSRAGSLSPRERVEMLRTVDRFVDAITQDVQSVARNALGGLTPRYKEMWEIVLERRREWLAELEQFKQLIQQNPPAPPEPPPARGRAKAG